MRLAVLVAFAAVLAGCGSTSGPSLEDAADATAAETSRFDATFRMTNPEAKGEEYDLVAEGLFDYPNERGLMTISGDLPFFSTDVQMREFRLLGRTGYTRWVFKGKSYWVKEQEEESGSSNDPTELLIPFPGSPTKPTDVLSRVLRASDENEVVGSEEVRGAETTHFRARVDLRKLVKQLPATERPEDDVVQLLGSVPVEIWIDDESRLRRITIDEREPEKDTNPVATTTTVELFDYGVEVEVEPPPSDELISQEEFDRLTGSSIAPEASGKGELVSPEEVCESVRQQLPKKEADRLCSELKGNP